MKKSRPQRLKQDNNRTVKLAALLALCAAQTSLPAYSAGTVAAVPSRIDFIQTRDKTTAFRLEASNAPLGQILQTISQKTGAIIHYSVLPEAPVTATCAGANVHAVMDCLVAKQLGLVAQKPEAGKPAEFWLLGSSVGSCKAVTVAAAPENPQPLEEHPPTPEEQAQADQAMQEQSDKLVEQARSKDPAQRAEAIGNLVSGGVKDDPNVRKVLEDALADKDAGIRAQAVATLAQREGGNADEILRQALNDKDASVRLAAVDQASDDTVLLRQALTDKDAGVRAYAAAKLAAMTKKEGN